MRWPGLAPLNAAVGKKPKPQWLSIGGRVASKRNGKPVDIFEDFPSPAKAAWEMTPTRGYCHLQSLEAV